MSELDEAATLKKQAQGLLAQADTVLSNKTLPDGVRDEISGLRTALTRTWSDLQDEADSVEVEDEEDEPEAVAEAEKPTELREQATSFSALRASRKTEEVATELIGLVYDFRILAENIVYSLGEEDKSGALRELAGEFSQEVDVILGNLAAPAESEPVVELEEVVLGESDVGAVIAIHESEDVEGNTEPLQLDVVVIKPGWGNEKDSHYYSREMLEKNAHAFNGAKMYATNHDPDQKNVLTEVSQVLACPSAFTTDGAPIARVGVFDAAFAENIRNRAALGKLEDLNVSIQASGTAKTFELDGRKGKAVESISPDGANVDWVTRAGAGGHALRIAESAEEPDMEKEERTEELEEEETAVKEAEKVAIEEVDAAAFENAVRKSLSAEVVEQEPAEVETVEEETPAPLGESEASVLLAESSLPDAARERLAQEDWSDESALGEAIASEVTYVTELTGAGRPVGQQVTVVPVEEQQSKEDRLDALYIENEKRHGVYRGKEED